MIRLRSSQGRDSLFFYAAILLAIFLLIIIHSCSPADRNEKDTSRKTIRIGYVSWTDSTSMTYLARQIIEKRLGYNVEMILADPAPVFTSLASGDIDLFLSAWLPTTHQNYMKRYGDQLEDLGPLYEGAKIGLVVPGYSKEKSIRDLKNRKDAYNGKITGIDSGAGIMMATNRAIKDYNLEFELISSSEAAMTASLQQAIRKKKNIVITGWKPHWKFARWDLRFLDDPRGIYGKEESIHAMARPGFTSEHGNIAAMVKKMHFTDGTFGRLMELMNEYPDSPEHAAKLWVEIHRSMVDDWVRTPGSEK